MTQFFVSRWLSLQSYSRLGEISEKQTFGIVFMLDAHSVITRPNKPTNSIKALEVTTNVQQEMPNTLGALNYKYGSRVERHLQQGLYNIWPHAPHIIPDSSVELVTTKWVAAAIATCLLTTFARCLPPEADAGHCC